MTVPVEQCMVVSEVKQAAKQQAIGDVTVTDTGHGFYVQVEVHYTPPRRFWLTSKRARSEPRLFKHLGRLHNQLRTLVPASNVHIVRARPIHDSLS